MEDFDERWPPEARWLRGQEFRWAVLASPALCVVLAFLETGPARVAWGIGAVCLAAILLPAVTRGRPLAHALAQGFRILVALTLTLGGLAGCAGAIYLFTLGSYAMLASFLLFPVAAVAAYVGQLLLFAGGGAGARDD